ncbi:hypothetical protein AVEN_151098-1 [Araneus ventricosus]|uniref:CCHC-type domain-containing protein n=1 Tax=Araneus ventricosus TaxID=182803 RepID=A0A4Y2Q3B6_ARAVE|nr:hypothetical protein AVEN_151098-1 [Araneus ventricosus]
MITNLPSCPQIHLILFFWRPLPQCLEVSLVTLKKRKDANQRLRSLGEKEKGRQEGPTKRNVIKERESPKKDSSGIKIFSDFWASTPDHPKKAAITNSNTGKTPDLNLYDAITEILAKYKIEGNPATEIKDLVQVAVGQICALRSSVHNMEDRMNKMEERLNAHSPAPTFATIARAFAKSSETNTTKIVNASNKPGQNSKTKDQLNTAEAKIPETNHLNSDRRKAKAIKPSASANKHNRLRPKPVLPTVIVRSNSDEIKTAAQLKSRLENTISPNSIGVKIITSRLTINNGVVLQVQTDEMANKIREAINQNDTLKEVCSARKPKVRIPHIIIYDVEKREEGVTRETEEQILMEKIRKSNSLPPGETKVLFRKKGRGNREHWVVEIAPKIFAQIKDDNRLQCGFGSYRFKEYIEPMRCYKCHRFGHGKATCVQEQELCSKCPGVHSFKTCKNATPVCRNCREYNRTNNQKVRVNHVATSDKCPISLREKEQIKQKTHYGD